MLPGTPLQGDVAVTEAPEGAEDCVASLPASLTSRVCCRVSMLVATCSRNQHMCRLHVQAASSPSSQPSCQGAAESDTQAELMSRDADPQPAACVQDSCRQPTASFDACGLQTLLLHMYRRLRANVALPQVPRC